MERQSQNQTRISIKQFRFRIKDMRFFLAAALCLLPLGAQTKSSSALDKPTMEAYIRRLLAIGPEVQVKIDDPKPSAMPDLRQVDVHLSLGGRSQDETFFVSANGKKLVRGIIYDVTQNPFQADLDKLKTSQAPSFGPSSAPVTMVVFSDFQCPNCKEEAKLIRDNVNAKFPKEVRVYFKNFPLEAIHNWAKAAAIDGRCVFNQSPDGFWKYHDWIYEHQGEITADNLKEKVLEWSKSVELDNMQLGRCIENKSTEGEINSEVAEAQSLKIDATPTSFINGRRLIGNYPWVNLEQIINGELKYQQASSAAADKCCEVTIPSPLKK